MARIAAIIMAVLVAWPAWAGVVRMLDGTSHEGQIALDEGNQLVVKAAGGEAVRVGLDRVLLAQFRSSEASAKGPQRRWIGRDIGRVRVPGSARFVGDSATIRGSGAEMEGANEGGYFVYQMVEGDGQIVARVSSVQKTDARAFAGVMIRANAEAGVPHAMMMAYAEEGTRYQLRARPGASTPRWGGAFGVPCWVKLVRRGNVVSGFVSQNGEDWQQVRAETVQLPARALFGLVVCARSGMNVCTATFERVTIADAGEERAASKVARLGEVVLRQGSVISGEMRAMSDSAVRVVRGQEVSIPATEVARVQGMGLKAETEAKLQGGRRGVLLNNGDFAEGEVLGIEGDRVRLSSVLFGLQRIELRRVTAVVLREPMRGATQYEVRVADGSILLSDRVKVEGGMLSVEVPFFGTLKYSVEQIKEIRAGGARFRSLAELKPAKGEASADVVVNGMPNGAAMSLRGQSCEQGIGMLAGASAVYGLNQEYGVLMFRAGVPDEVLPTAGVQFVVWADGQEVYRSPPRTSVDDALAVTLKVAGVKELMLRVEGARGDSIGACGLFGDVVLIK